MLDKSKHSILLLILFTLFILSGCYNSYSANEPSGESHNSALDFANLPDDETDEYFTQNDTDDPSADTEEEYQNFAAPNFEIMKVDAETIQGLWIAEPFGDRGGAQIIIRSITKESFSFEIYVYRYKTLYYADDFKTLSLTGFDGVATFASHGEFDYCSKGYVYVGFFENIRGKIYFGDNILQIRYDDMETRDGFSADVTQKGDLIEISYEDGRLTYLPMYFTKVADSDIDSILSTRPLDYREITTPYPARLTLEEADELFGEPLKTTIEEFYGTYNLITKVYKDSEVSIVRAIEEDDDDFDNNIVQVFKTTNPEISLARGIKIGDSMEMVISKFPCEQEITPSAMLHMIDNESIFVLYGEPEHEHVNGRILYRNDTPVEILYNTIYSWIVFELDSNGNVSKICYSLAGW